MHVFRSLLVYTHIYNACKDVDFGIFTKLDHCMLYTHSLLFPALWIRLSLCQYYFWCYNTEILYLYFVYSSVFLSAV